MRRVGILVPARRSVYSSNASSDAGSIVESSANVAAQSSPRRPRTSPRPRRGFAGSSPEWLRRAPGRHPSRDPARTCQASPVPRRSRGIRSAANRRAYTPPKECATTTYGPRSPADSSAARRRGDVVDRRCGGRSRRSGPGPGRSDAQTRVNARQAIEHIPHEPAAPPPKPLSRMTVGLPLPAAVEVHGAAVDVHGRPEARVDRGRRSRWTRGAGRRPGGEPAGRGRCRSRARQPARRRWPTGR